MLSDFEMSRELTRPISRETSVETVSDEISKALESFRARQKLAPIMKSKSTFEPDLKVGDSIEIYSKRDFGKCGKWSDPKPILKIDFKPRSVTVPGQRSQAKTVAFKNVRLANSNNDLRRAVMEAMVGYAGLVIELTNNRSQQIH